MPSNASNRCALYNKKVKFIKGPFGPACFESMSNNCSQKCLYHLQERESFYKVLLVSFRQMGHNIPISAGGLMNVGQSISVEKANRMMLKDSPDFTNIDSVLNYINKTGLYQLIKIAKDSKVEPEIRKKIIHKLGRESDNESVETLLDIVAQNDKKVLENAQKSLEKIKQSFQHDVKKLLDAYKSKNKKVSVFAKEILIELNHKKYIRPLGKAMKNETIKIKKMIIKIISEIHDKKAYKVIKKCLKDENEEIRKAADKALLKFDFGK